MNEFRSFRQAFEFWAVLSFRNGKLPCAGDRMFASLWNFFCDDRGFRVLRITDFPPPERITDNAVTLLCRQIADNTGIIPDREQFKSVLQELRIKGRGHHSRDLQHWWFGFDDHRSVHGAFDPEILPYSPWNSEDFYAPVTEVFCRVALDPEFCADFAQNEAETGQNWLAAMQLLKDCRKSKQAAGKKK